MVATQFTRSERRALRWMRKHGVGLQPSEDAFGVLAARLGVRFRAGLAVWPLFVLAFAVWTVRTAPAHPDTAALWARTARTVVPVLGFGLAFTGFAVWCARADRAIARAVSTRVTRTAAVTARVVLGPFAAGALALILVLQVAVTSLLAARASGADAVAFGAGVAAVWVVCLSVLRVVLRRPTVAPDSSALAVDERLRAFDALYALWPVGWSALALVGPLDLRGVQDAELIILLAAAGMMISVVLPFSHPGERARYGFGRSVSRA